VLVVLLDEDAGAFSVPSKVLTYLTAERPILGAMPLANLAARTILEIGAGRVVPPSDPEGFVIAAKELLNAPAERSRAGSAGRGYAANAFEIDPIADRFEEILERASSRTARRLGNASGRAWQSTTAQTEKGQ
jgi:glycosyltransferase involved in cell wall biosynthesis